MAITKYFTGRVMQVIMTYFKVFHSLPRMTTGKGTPKVGRCWAAASPNPQKLKFKNTDFVDIISNIICDIPFSQNLPLKSADD
jgi:hypothetical protein